MLGTDAPLTPLQSTDLAFKEGTVEGALIRLHRSVWRGAIY